jgi:hypothetical protein
MSAVNLASWVLAAILTVLGFCSSCKRAAERATERYLLRRKARARRLQARLDRARLEARLAEAGTGPLLSPAGV